MTSEWETSQTRSDEPLAVSDEPEGSFSSFSCEPLTANRSLLHRDESEKKQ